MRKFTLPLAFMLFACVAHAQAPVPPVFIGNQTQSIGGVLPAQIMTATTQAADSRRWVFNIVNGVLKYQITKDNGTLPVSWLEVTRTGATSAAVKIPSLWIPNELNFSSTLGSGGFGIRNNAGSMEFKNTAGTWLPISASGVTAGGGWTHTSGVIAADTGTDRVQAGNINNIRHASVFDGANAGEKIVAAIANLPATGGTVDARGFEGAQVISQNMFAGVTKVVNLIFGHATFSMSVGQVIEVQGTTIKGSCGSYSSCTEFKATAGIIPFTVKDRAGTYSENIELSDFYVDCNTTAASAFLIYKNHDSVYNNLQARNCTASAFDIQDEVYVITFHHIQARASLNGVKLTSPNGTTIQKVTFDSPELVLNTGSGMLIDVPNTSINLFQPSFELNDIGLSITGQVLNVNIVGGHFERNEADDVKCYKSSADSAGHGGRGINFLGGFFSGNETTSAYAFNILGCSAMTLQGIYTEKHQLGGLNFSNAGLTGALNRGNLLLNSNINELTPISAADGLNIVNKVTQDGLDENFLENGVKFIVDENGSISMTGVTPTIMLNDTGGIRSFSMRNAGNSLIFRDIVNGIDTTLSPGGGLTVGAFLKVEPRVFSTLSTPCSTSEGQISTVTDSTTVVWGATITGGGANHVLAYCNGTNWTVMGK